MNNWHLRVTVLPQCNFRCIYCNPNSEYENSKILSEVEILDIVKASYDCGIRRVHWTGGEPCMKDILSLIQGATDLGYTEQIITTNGSLKVNQIAAMANAGLTRVNISLDTLDSIKNKQLTGNDFFETTLQWIEEACKIFTKPTKMNIVALKKNSSETKRFIEFAQKFNGKLMLKFIELCPNNPAFYGRKIQSQFTSRKTLISSLEKVGSIKQTSIYGDNPNAEYYVIGNTGVTVILVTMPSQNYKCGLDKCRKLRISPFGLAGSCIQHKGISLLNLPYTKKVEVIKKLIMIREKYSNTPPVTRKHLRKEYGIWRFGEITNSECSKC